MKLKVAISDGCGALKRELICSPVALRGGCGMVTEPMFSFFRVLAFDTLVLFKAKARAS